MNNTKSRGMEYIAQRAAQRLNNKPNHTHLEYLDRSERSIKRRRTAFFVVVIMLAALLVGALTADAGTVADTLFLECRGETVEGQRAVATVIFNRARAQGKLPAAICLARKQFSCHNKGKATARPRNAVERGILARFEEWERQMQTGSFKPAGPWDHYYAHQTVKPKWKSRLSKSTRIGNHTFGLYI